MNFSELNDHNWILFAIKNYENPSSATIEDFNDDMKRFKYIKRLLKRYEKLNQDETSHVVHLLLNHIIVLFNIFNDAAVPLLFYKIEKEYWPVICAFLYYLNRLPEDFIQTSTLDVHCLRELSLL